MEKALKWFFLSFMIAHSYAEPLIVAHRGVHHDYARANEKGCRLLKPPQKHEFIENTLPSIEAAFSKGADIVEIDIVATKDQELVLMHEIELDCYTNLKGRVQDYSLKELRKADIAHGYSFDNLTFPWRGQGIGKITTLKEVLAKHPNKLFMLNPKEQRLEVLYPALEKYFESTPGINYQNLYFWGDEELYRKLKKKYNFNRYISIPNRSVNCNRDARNYFWFGYFPSSCHGLHLSLMPDQLLMMGGWPDSFSKEALNYQGSVWLFAPNFYTSLSPIKHLSFQAVIVSNIDEWSLSR